MKKAILLGVTAMLGAAAIIPSTSFAQSSQSHWELITGDPFPDSVTQVVAGPGDLVYMATSDKGVFKSTDEGENWTEINTGIYSGGLDITMLAIGPNGDLLSRDGYGNIIYSKDAFSWIGQGVPWYWTYPGAVLTTFAFDSHGAAYAGTIGAGIYKMDSIGKWDQVMPPNIIPGVQAMLFDNQDRLIIHYDKLYRLKSDFSAIDTSWWVKTGVRNAPFQLLKSTWGSVLAVGDTLCELTDHLQKLAPMGDEVLVVDSMGVLNSFSNGLLQSTDHGITWQNNPGKIVHGPASERFLEATNYGFISSGDGEPEVSVSFDSTFAFLPIHELDNALKINEIDVDSNQTIQAFDELKGIWSSTDRGFTWRRRMSRQNIQGTLMEDGKYYASRWGQIATWPPMVSEDGGVNYKPVNVPLGLDAGFYASPNGTYWAEFGSAHFLRSLDGGATWNEFAHFTDVPPAYFKSDSSESGGVVERGPYIWLATVAGVHLTSDEGVTWQFDTAHYIFNYGITGGKGSTIITHTSGEGVHWLSPGESVDSSWLHADGPYVEARDGTMLQFTLPNYSENLELFLKESKDGRILDTLSITPDSVSFCTSYETSMTIDSAGNIFAARVDAGLFRFVSANASVSPQSPQSADALTVSVSNETLTIRSTSELRDIELMDVAGRMVQRVAVSNSLACSTSVAGIPNGAYFVKAETAGGFAVRKVMILH